MSYLSQTILSVVLVTSAIGSWAQTDAEHAQHHPNTPMEGQSSSKKANSMTNSAEAEKMTGMQSKMKEMHEKMMNAKSPDERKALMAEHMKTMKDGMAMMSMMGGSGMAGMPDKKPHTGTMTQRQQMMEMRMGMMESMMQMMMDEMPKPDGK
jgi:hypothetical protein